MQGVLLFLNPEAVSEDVVALGLLPQVVELDQLTHRPVEISKYQNIKISPRDLLKISKLIRWKKAFSGVVVNLQSRFHLFK